MHQPKNTRTRRLLRTLALTRNPLCRPVDRTDGALRLVAALLAVLLTAACVVLGLAGYRRDAADAAALRAELIRVPVVLLAGVPAVRGDYGGSTATPVTRVPARWTVPATGRSRSGEVYIRTTAAKGATVTVWMNRSYQPTPPPRSTLETVSGALLVGGIVWILSTLGLWIGYQFADFLLGQRRDAAWTRDWLRFEKQWRHSV